MLSVVLPVLALSSQAYAQSLVQGFAPSPVVLSTTKSGVLPVLPATPFAGVDTIEGAIVNAAPPNASYTGLGGTATVATNLPAVTYRADLPTTQFNPYVGTNVRGSVVAVGTTNGTRFTVNITGLPNVAQYGPFPYHIHALPVPSDGNCTSTLGHLDPTNVGEYYMCNTAAPQTCQVGDLAGKHGGKITTTSFATSFVDPYLSTNPSSNAFFGGLAFVVHTGNTTRITCANFVQVSGNSTSPSPSPSSTSTGTPVQYTGAADRMAAAGLGAVAVGLFGLVL